MLFSLIKNNKITFIKNKFFLFIDPWKCLAYKIEKLVKSTYIYFYWLDIN